MSVLFVSEIFRKLWNEYSRRIRQQSISLNLGSDPKHIPDIVSLPVGGKYQYHHTATAGFRTERGHCARLRLYWYNGQY